MSSDFTTSGVIHFTGLGNGTDFDSIIQATLQAEGIHKQRLEIWQEDWDKKNEYFEVFQSQLLSLRTHLQTMDSMDEFLKKEIAIADESLLTATATSSAAEGTHTIEVNQLAQNDIQVSQHSYGTKDDVVNSSGGDQLLRLTYGSDTFDITVEDGTTLTGLINKINNSSGNTGIRASALYDGTGYYLQLKGMDLGSGNDITVDAATTVSNLGNGTYDVVQTAQNAKIKVDGWPTGAGNWIELATNTVTDIIEGVTLNLKNAPDDAAILADANAVLTTQITIANDEDAIVEQVQTFIDKVNEVRSTLLQLTKFDDQTKKGSILQGNYGMQIISSRLKEVTSTKGAGFDYDEDALSTLSQIGIFTDAQEGSPTRGLLTLDSEKLLEKISEDSTGVAALFAEDGTRGATNSTDFNFDSAIKTITKAGEYDVTYTVDGSGNITAAQINGEDALISGNRITATGADNPANGLAIVVSNTTAGNYSGSVRLKQGKAAEMVDTIADLAMGEESTLKILRDNYRDIRNNIQKKIDEEEDRLTKLERTLRLKYSRLEAVLGQYESQKKSLESQLKQLSSK